MMLDQTSLAKRNPFDSLVEEPPKKEVSTEQEKKSDQLEKPRVIGTIVNEGQVWEVKMFQGQVFIELKSKDFKK